MLREREAVDSFTTLVKQVETRLQHALIPVFGVELAREATAEALAYGWEHWERVGKMENPAGYLYRVAQTAGRRARRKPAPLPPVGDDRMPWVEPGLPEALTGLSPRQRTVVWLVHGLDWKHVEVAEFLGISPGSVQTHSERGLEKLQRALGGRR
jgi:RNA polymerase sigma-70 factor (ECF subfamily)